MHVLQPFLENYVFLNYLFGVVFVVKCATFQSQKSENWKLTNFIYFDSSAIAIRKSRRKAKVIQNMLSSLLATILLIKLILLVVLCIE
jgi:hypothetical protein